MFKRILAEKTMNELSILPRLRGLMCVITGLRRSGDNCQLPYQQSRTLSLISVFSLVKFVNRKRLFQMSNTYNLIINVSVIKAMIFLSSFPFLSFPFLSFPFSISNTSPFQGLNQSFINPLAKMVLAGDGDIPLFIKQL